jgi:Na+-transporting NADH:ubiquinone oxidoreductase subunit A
LSRASATARFRLRRGLDLPLAGAADPDRIEEAPPIRSVALLGADAPGVRPELRVAQGERVRLGQTLFVDRRRPQIRFTAPGAGVVRSIERGARRRLEAVVIELEGEDGERFDPCDARDVATLPRERVEGVLLASGLWTALRTRPFSRIPDPGSAPAAIFVTAIATDPLAPPVQRVAAEGAADFAVGLAALTRLTSGLVHVCTRPDAGLALPELERVSLAEFEGPHPAGLPGTHMHCIDPAGPDRTLWQVGCADVLALGRLLVTGRPCVERVVALTGPALARPRLVRTRIGASTEDLVRGSCRETACRVISGSALSGRDAVGAGAYLGRLHTQVCVLAEPRAGEPRPWLAPGWRGRARRVFGRPFGAARALPLTTALGGRPGVFFPLERLERVMPGRFLVAPLLRALVVGDEDAAVALGCLELAEEDLALASFLCPGKLDYGALLRATLDQIEGRDP